MSVFGPNQVEEVLIGNAVASETTLATFISGASDGELKILSADGTAPAVGKDFKVYQKTAGDSTKNLNYEFSDIVKAKKVEKVILATYAAEVQKSIRATVGSATANTTYVLEVRIYNDGGTLSPENFAVVSGYYVTGATAGTVQAIRDGLLASLNHNLKLRGNGELVTATNSTDAIDITGKAQVVVPGKIVGKQIEFDVFGKAFDNVTLIAENTGAITLTVLAAGSPGRGTGKYAINLEWFAKGYKYDAARYGGWPADFQDRTPYYASAAGVYNVIHIKYFDDRISPGLEQQKKVITILINKGTDTLANNANTNLILDSLQTILGAANVPADLAVE
jgi:hypothetical protein